MSPLLPPCLSDALVTTTASLCFITVMCTAQCRLHHKLSFSRPPTSMSVDSWPVTPTCFKLSHRCWGYVCLPLLVPLQLVVCYVRPNSVLSYPVFNVFYLTTVYETYYIVIDKMYETNCPYPIIPKFNGSYFLMACDGKICTTHHKHRKHQWR